MPPSEAWLSYRLLSVVRKTQLILPNAPRIIPLALRYDAWQYETKELTAIEALSIECDRMRPTDCRLYAVSGFEF